MGTIYRVTMTKEITDDKGGYEGSETLFELAGSSVMMGRIAPAAILDAMIADDGSAAAVPPQQQVLADRVWDAAVANGTVPGPAAEDAQPEKPKRTRRTKQQIVEDEAKEKQRAAMQEQANSAGQGGPGGYMTPDGPVVEAPAPPAAEAWPAEASMPGAPAAVPAPSAAPAVQYNPFAS